MTRTVFLVLWLLAWPATRSTGQPSLSVDPLPFPGQRPSAQPNLARSADGHAYLSWIETADGEHALRFARLDGDRFAKPRTIAKGRDWFVNWADVPSMAVGPKGTMAAQWLRRLGKGTYAYGVRVRCSTDGGDSWGPAFWLHRDRSPVEHGFVSLLPESEARFLAVWLDARDQKTTGDMALRSVAFGADGERDAERVLDDRVCECCPTAIASTGDIDVVAYRDRSADDVRDIRIVRREGGTWTSPEVCRADEWMTPS